SYGGKRGRSDSDDGVAQHADFLDLAFDDVTWPQELLRVATGADAGRSASCDDVTGFERHHARNLGYQLRDVKEHEARVAVLLFDTVDACLEREILGIADLVGGDDAGPHRRETVLTL